MRSPIRWLKAILTMTTEQRRRCGIANSVSAHPEASVGRLVGRYRVRGVPLVPVVRIWLWVNHRSIWREFHNLYGEWDPVNPDLGRLGHPLPYRHLWRLAKQSQPLPLEDLSLYR